ncbi:hypothetical protein, partial [Promicromonospora xylanilytica]
MWDDYVSRRRLLGSLGPGRKLLGRPLTVSAPALIGLELGLAGRLVGATSPDLAHLVRAVDEVDGRLEVVGQGVGGG